MPYITKTARQIIDSGGEIQTAGELNYAFTQAIKRWDRRKELIANLDQLILQYIKTNGLSYRVINDILGALEGAKFEAKRRLGWYFDEFDEVKSDFYRRVAAPYEDEKIKLNGDVY